MIILACVIALLVFGSPAYAAVALIFLSLALAPYLLPVTYRLDDNGVRAGSAVFSRCRPWSAFRTYQTYDAGVLLTPFAVPSALGPTRGLFLRFAGNADAVLAAVAARLRPVGSDG